MRQAARVKESRSSEGGQSLVFKKLSTFSNLIVPNLPFLDNDEALGTRSETYQTYYLLPDLEAILLLPRARLDGERPAH